MTSDEIETRYEAASRLLISGNPDSGSIGSLLSRFIIHRYDTKRLPRCPLKIVFTEYRGAYGTEVVKLGGYVCTVSSVALSEGISLMLPTRPLTI